jgi:two-component system, chemotaxis family, sensor kinase Cph1
MQANLYADFRLTLENCSVEPIHRPLATQGHGQIMVFHHKRPQFLYAMNEYFPVWLGKSEVTLWEQPVESWMPESLLSSLGKLQDSDTDRILDSTSFDHKDKSFNAISHVHAGVAFLEIERSQNRAAAFSTFQRIMDRMRSCRSLDELFDVTSQHAREILGYDRVMIYQFDKDFHGTVVGESKEPRLEPFLGLHYPATDIPAMSRDLLLKNRSRSISDIRLPNERLRFNPDLGLSIPYLDLSMCQLRATSPVHIEYLSHMGVRATLTLAIVQEGKLWGLVACHHDSPRAPEFELRKMGEAIADLFSVRIAELQRNERRHRIAAARDAEQKLLEQIRVGDHYKLELSHDGKCLEGICMADGVAAVTTDGVLCSIGTVPANEDILLLRNWLTQCQDGELFVTDDLTRTVPISAAFSTRIGGMLAARVSEVSQNYLVWFRLPHSQITDWAGDPSKTLESERRDESEEVRLSPRKSFAKWQEAVEDRSLPWDSDEIATVSRIRNTILKFELQRTTANVVRSRQEFMQLIYAASHDLQEPLRTQLNYLDLLGEELHSSEHDEWQHYVIRASHAVYRMQALIADLLDYASLGMQTKREPIELQSLITEIQEDLSQAVNKKHANIRVGKLPRFKGNRSEFKQLFQNLLTNAMKYVAPDIIPNIEISARREGRFVVFSIIDNGIGIAEEHFEKIFLMFQRLHSREEYEGTGIGLALCKKIVENYDGQIGVCSTVGTGSNFWMKFHDISIVGDFE